MSVDRKDIHASHGKQLGDDSPVTFIEAIDRLAMNGWGEKNGFTFMSSGQAGETFMPFASMRGEVRRRAAILLEKGIVPGDRVALVLPDPQDFVLSFLAVAYSGAVAVPMYPPMSLGKLEQYLESSARILNASGAKLLITSKQVETILWPVLKQAPAVGDLFTVEKWKASAENAVQVAGAKRKMDDLVFLQFTSGSTADPKGVRVTHGSLFGNATSLLRSIDANPAVDMGVSWLPLYHDMGLIGFVLGPLYYSISCTFIPTLSFIKKPTLWLDVLSKKKGTITFAPNFAYSLVEKRAQAADLGKWDLSSVRVAGCGAEPIQADTVVRFTKKFAACGFHEHALFPAYGMAEATLAVAFNPMMREMRIDVIDKNTYRDEKKAKPVLDGAGMSVISVGFTFPEHELAIVGDSGMRMRDREVGEIIFSGPSVADGYYERPEASAAAFRKDTNGKVWLHTGDLGYMADGELYICGRKKDLIIIKGRNYYPQAIEWAVEQIDGVRKGNIVAFSVQESDSEALVVSCEARKGPPANLGETIKRTLTEQFSLACKDVVVLEPGQLPKTSSGKLQRQKTKQLYLSGELQAQGQRTYGARASRVKLAQHVLRSLQVKVRHRTRRFLQSFALEGKHS